MGPGAGQPRQAVLVLRQFDLQDAVAGVGVLGEDIQDEGGPVENADVLAKALFQFAQVARGEFVIKHDDLRQEFFDQGFDLVNFSRPNKGIRVGGIQLLSSHPNHI